MCVCVCVCVCVVIRQAYSVHRAMKKEAMRAGVCIKRSKTHGFFTHSLVNNVVTNRIEAGVRRLAK